MDTKCEVAEKQATSCLTRTSLLSCVTSHIMQQSVKPKIASLGQENTRCLKLRPHFRLQKCNE